MSAGQDGNDSQTRTAAFNQASGDLPTLADFQRAVDNFKVSMIDCGNDAKSEEALRERLEKSPVLLLGEDHGVEQIPNIIYTLFKKFGFRHLAIEWGDDNNGWADKFMAQSGAKLDVEALRDTCGGGIAPGHVAVIQQLKKEGLLEKITCFHPTVRLEAGESETRETLMAEKLASRLSGTPTLVCTGNLHSRRQPVPESHGAKFPMGYHLNKLIPGVQEARIDSLSGQFFGIYGDPPVRGIGNFTDRSSLSPDGKPRFFYNDKTDAFVFELPKALPVRALIYYQGQTNPGRPADDQAPLNDAPIPRTPVPAVTPKQ